MDWEPEDSASCATPRSLESLPATGLPLPSLDFERLKEFNQRQEHRAQNAAAPRSVSPAPDYHGRSVQKKPILRLARLSRLDGNTKAKVGRSVQTSHVKSWLHAHGYVVKADKLHPAVTRVIAEWFDLVDDDGSRTLEHHELLAALKAAQIPCDDDTIEEMINLMDMNRDGVIGWDEFEVFMTEEFAAGKSLLSGEYLLPSGLALNFGVMIGKLKRDKLLGDVMQEGAARNQWADIARDPELLGRELATMQEAAEATNLTLEHIMRTEAGDASAATPRTQLTNALLQEMEANRRRRDKAEERWTGVKDKLRNGSLGPELTRRGLHPVAPATAAATGRGSSLDFPSGLHQQHQHQHQHQHQASWGGAACPDPLAAPPPPGGLAQPLLSLGAAMGASSSPVPCAGAWAAAPAGSGGPGGMAAAALAAASRSATPAADGGSAGAWGWPAAAPSGSQQGLLASRSGTPSGTAGGGAVPGLPLSMMAALGPTGPLQLSASPQPTGPRRGHGHGHVSSHDGGHGSGLDLVTNDDDGEAMPLPTDGGSAWGAGAPAVGFSGRGLEAASSSVEALPSMGSVSVLPPRPRVATAHTAASRSHQREPRRAISAVGHMAEELRASGATPLERAANAAAASATAVGLGLGLPQGPSSRASSPGPGLHHPHTHPHPHPHPHANAHGAHALVPSHHATSHPHPHPHHRHGHGHGHPQPAPGPQHQPPHKPQGASHSRFANLSRPASRAAATATGATGSALGSNSSLSPPQSPRGRSAPLTQFPLSGGDDSYGTVQASSPIPSVPYYTAAAPPPPSYNGVLLPILSTPSELNAFVETAVGAARAEGTSAGAVSIGGSSSSRSASPAPGLHAPYVHPHPHGQAARSNFGNGHSHDNGGAGAGAASSGTMEHMSELLTAVLQQQQQQQQQQQPSSSLGAAAGVAAGAEPSELSSPAAPVPLSLRRDLSGEDDPGLMLPYNDSSTTNSYGSLGRGRAPYTDRSATPSPAGTARGGGSCTAAGAIWPQVASGGPIVMGGAGVEGGGSGCNSARDPAALLQERKTVVRAALNSLIGMTGLPGAAGTSAPAAGTRSAASATATGSDMGGGGTGGDGTAAGCAGGRWSRAGTPTVDGAGAGASAGAGNGRAFSSAPHESLAMVAESAATAALAGTSISGSSHGGTCGSTGVDATSAEWISYTRTRASAVGPTPLAAPAVHAHYGSRSSSPRPQALAGRSSASGAGAAAVAQLAAVVDGLGATAAVISAAAQEAAVAGVMPPPLLGVSQAVVAPRSTASVSGSYSGALASGGAVVSSKALRPTSTLLRTSSIAAASAAGGLTDEPALRASAPSPPPGRGVARGNTHSGCITSAPAPTVPVPSRAQPQGAGSSAIGRPSCERASCGDAPQPPQRLPPSQQHGHGRCQHPPGQQHSEELRPQQQLVLDGGVSAVELLHGAGDSAEQEADAEVARLMMMVAGPDEAAHKSADAAAPTSSPDVSVPAASAPAPAPAPAAHSLAPAPAPAPMTRATTSALEGPWPAEVTRAWRDRSPMPDSASAVAAASSAVAAASVAAAASARASSITGRSEPLLSLSRAQWRASGTSSCGSRPGTATGLASTLGVGAAPSPDPVVAAAGRDAAPAHPTSVPSPSRAASNPHLGLVATAVGALGAQGANTSVKTAALSRTTATSGPASAGRTSSVAGDRAGTAAAVPTAATAPTPPAVSGTSSAPLGQRGTGGVVINFSHASSTATSARPSSNTGLGVYGPHTAGGVAAAAAPASAAGAPTASAASSRPASVTGCSAIGGSSFSGSSSLPSRPASVLGMSYGGAAGSRPGSRLGAHMAHTACGGEARVAPPRSRTSLAMRPGEKEDHLAQSSWCAATASQMQLRRSKQLTTTGAAPGPAAGGGSGGAGPGSAVDGRARAWGSSVSRETL
ncbi:hypothetical protein HYH02_006332 [Chlamydomonas schloesseri]|uniref:EF-hand domain-containing protein n=1 Tax=Chlamydomonas schloesseri TaxID=2026947 RepID=A0A835WKD8_9CHLO|nr:hypothetical protein HYH02_006332 [Chlamydomonas schloesseri]|eukprot:KAG2448440.1 hypothetical protein HYH02_006332 [Chlamydomonas schloesseri]